MSAPVTRLRGRERGVALAAAVFVLVALAALLAGLWFAALQEYRVGANVVSDRRAFDAAEAGLDVALADWQAGAMNRLGITDTTPFSGSLSGGARYSGVVQRLAPWLFLLRSTGSDATGSRRTLAVTVRLAPLRLPVEAALVASGPVRIGAGALVDALAGDTGGSCAGAPRTAAGVVLGDAADLQISECPVRECLRGDPAWNVDPALRSAPVPLLGDAGWASLLAAADTIGTGGILAPTSPVWFAPGDFSLQAGAPAAPLVLLVQGDLVVESGAQLSGLIVVRGRLIMRGAGGSILGSVLAEGAEFWAVGGAKATLVYSHCAVEQALQAAAPARPLAERSWTALY